ncbi:MAG: carbon storage regulator CsrA [Pirellulaceae bacterium]|nr:carbon storage regulator CsrA [Pirellulaceae bacterium]
MLVLSRKRDESIIIGKNIVLTIVDIRGDKVRLGIVAPSTVPVHRKEVHDALQRERSAASPAITSPAAVDAPSASTTNTP